MALPIPDALERLVGLQAQAPMPPYLALHARLHRFDPTALGRMLTEREAARLTLMRGTVHLVTVADARLLRPLVQVVIERGHNGVYRRRMSGVDPARLAAAVREELAASDGLPTARELAERLVERGIGDDLEAIANAIRVFVPVVQVPPRGVWGAGGQARYATLEDWTGAGPDADPSMDTLVLRYLRGFGPATVMDAQSWSGLTRLKPVFERLRGRLATFRDEDGKELFDLPDAPRPPADTAAPVRLLGEYDNVLLGHDDRRRMVPDDFPHGEVPAAGRSLNHLLVDGQLSAAWWIERDGRRRTTLGIRPYLRLPRADRAAVRAEAEGVLEFAAADAGASDLRFEPAPVSRAPAARRR